MYRLDYFGYSFILAYNACLQFLGHLKQACPFCLGYSLDRNAGHHCNYLGNLLFINHFPVKGKFLFPPLFLCFDEVKDITFLIAEAGSAFIILVFNRVAFFLLGILKLFLECKYLFRYNDIGNMYP